MIYSVLADVVLVLHFGFIVFVVLGGLLALRWPRAALVHLPAAAYGILIELFGWVCPLTPIENSLRRSAGEAGYSGGFIEHYLLPVIYPGGLTREVQLVLAGVVVVVNVVVYLVVWRRLGK
ncbi:MAG: DUF2784 domain-containing protein [Gemmatimonadota bacterium]